MAPSQIEAALSHISPTSSNEEILQALQHIANHDHEGRPLPKSTVTFIAHNKAVPDVDASPAPAPAAPASGSPDMNTLLGMLKCASDGPATAKTIGFAPAPTNIAVIPPTSDDSVLISLSYLNDMASMISLYSGIYALNLQKQREAKQPNGITDPGEATEVFADQANAAYLALTGPLSGFYNITSESTITYSKHMSKSDIHLEFLLEIFKGFSLDLNITSSREPSTIDQTLIIHQVQRTNVFGDDNNPVWAMVPKTRLIYMHIDSKTWAWAMNKASESGFDFNMHNVIVDATLNVEKFLGAKDKLDKIFVYLTDKDLQQFGTDVTGTAVKSDQIR